jgi:hypothetical protein
MFVNNITPFIVKILDVVGLVAPFLGTPDS